MEAMAAGVPVVQPRHGAFPEIVEKTGGGVLVESGDPEALADGLLALWRDPARAATMSKAGARGVREHYTVDRMAEEVERILLDLTGQCRPA
jgi:glycosyltransferase involved in cell wall biosynthesis